MICFFPHLLHCEMVWLTHSQDVSCLWIDVFECTLWYSILDEWSDLIMVTWFAPFPHLLHCELGDLLILQVGKLPLNRRVWVHIVIVYPGRVKWSDNGNMVCSFFPLTTLWTGVIRSYSGCKLPLNGGIWVHVVIIYPWWVKWSDNVTGFVLLFPTCYTVKWCDLLILSM